MCERVCVTRAVYSDRRCCGRDAYRKLPLSARQRNVSGVDGVVNVGDGIVDERRGCASRFSLFLFGGKLGSDRADKSRKP